MKNSRRSYGVTFAFPSLFDQAPEKTGAMHTERRFEVRRFVEIVFEFTFQIMILGTKKVTAHFSFGNHSISERRRTANVVRAESSRAY